MSNQIYQSVIVTGICPELKQIASMARVWEKATEMFAVGLVSNLTPVGYGCVQSFCIFPTGSSTGDEAQVKHSAAIEEFTYWLDNEMLGIQYIATRWSADDSPKITRSHETRFELPNVRARLSL